MSDKFQNKYRIESNRWRFWDYSAPGDYFITICIANREEILGRIVNGKMELSDCGKIVKSEFIKLSEYHERVFLDEWVIMPNHVHCIIVLGNISNSGVTEKIHEFSLNPPPNPKQLKTNPSESEIKQYRQQRRKMLIPKILGKFKMLTSKQINLLRKTPGYKNWQSDYHDHVIRKLDEYERIKQYIINNPKNWGNDKFNNVDM